MSFKEENDALIKSYLDRTFFRGFKDPTNDRYMNYNNMEIILNYKCNLACEYCYVNRFGDELYPEEYQDDELILKNLGILLDWVKKNNYDPKIEVFSGELFSQELGFKAVNIILDKLKGNKSSIVIPTNFTFLLSDELTRRVEELLIKGRKQGMNVFLSASFDGKYCEGNRPFAGTVTGHKISPGRVWTWERNELEDPRDDEYYDKVFAFSKKWGSGFHPMIYSNRIEYWKENFLWFQQKYEEFGLNWKNLYLLEIRNVEWSNKQIKEFTEFLKFVYRWAFDKCEKDFKTFKKFIFDDKGFNLLHSSLTSVGRGIGCSIQSTLAVRTGDLAIVPCHRTSYSHLLLGRFRVKDGEITGVEALNPELWIAIASFTTRMQPYCETCMLSPLCVGGCLGAQLEVTGDMFTPIPTVCKMIHAKIKAQIEVLKELGVYERLVREINPPKRRALARFEALIKEVK